MLQEIVKNVIGKEHRKLDYSLDEIEVKGEQPVLEMEVDDLVTVEAQDDPIISLRYLPLDENVMQHFFYNERAAQDSLYGSIVSRREEEYEAPKPVHESDDDTAYGSLTEEVHEDIKYLKYKFLDPGEVNPRKVELLSLYIAMNPAEFAFYEYLLGLNRDSAY